MVRPVNLAGEFSCRPDIHDRIHPNISQAEIQFYCYCCCVIPGIVIWRPFRRDFLMICLVLRIGLGLRCDCDAGVSMTEGECRKVAGCNFSQILLTVSGEW